MGKTKELINQWIKNILSNPFKSIAAVIGVAIPLYLFFFQSPAQEEQQETAKKTQLGERLSSLYSSDVLLLNECTLIPEMKKHTSSEEISKILAAYVQEVNESIKKVLELKQDKFVLAKSTNDEIKEFVSYSNSLAGYIEANGSCPERTKSQDELYRKIQQILKELTT